MKKKLTKTAFKSSAVAIALALGAGGAGANVAFASSEGGEEESVVNVGDGLVDLEGLAETYSSLKQTRDAKTAEEIGLEKIYVKKESGKSKVCLVFDEDVTLGSDIDATNKITVKLEGDSNITSSDKSCEVTISSTGSNEVDSNNKRIWNLEFSQEIETPDNITKVTISCDGDATVTIGSTSITKDTSGGEEITVESDNIVAYNSGESASFTLDITSAVITEVGEDTSTIILTTNEYITADSVTNLEDEFTITASDGRDINVESATLSGDEVILTVKDNGIAASPSAYKSGISLLDVSNGDGEGEEDFTITVGYKGETCKLKDVFDTEIGETTQDVSLVYLDNTKPLIYLEQAEANELEQKEEEKTTTTEVNLYVSFNEIDGELEFLENGATVSKASRETSKDLIDCFNVTVEGTEEPVEGLITAVELLSDTDGESNINTIKFTVDEEVLDTIKDKTFTISYDGSELKDTDYGIRYTNTISAGETASTDTNVDLFIDSLPDMTYTGVGTLEFAQDAIYMKDVSDSTTTESLCLILNYPIEIGTKAKSETEIQNLFTVKTSTNSTGVTPTKVTVNDGTQVVLEFDNNTLNYTDGEALTVEYNVSSEEETTSVLKLADYPLADISSLTGEITNVDTLIQDNDTFKVGDYTFKVLSLENNIVALISIDTDTTADFTFTGEVADGTVRLYSSVINSLDGEYNEVTSFKITQIGDGTNAIGSTITLSELNNIA